jgi:hypothetical protein
VGLTRNGGVWTQQGSKLVGAGSDVQSDFGYSVALSADGNTAIGGGPGDGSNTGAAWIFARNNGVWTQQGSKLVSNSVYPAQQGTSVALSADGNTAVVGAPIDGGAGAGAAWVYTRSGGVWTQQGIKLVGTGAVGATAAEQGGSVALSADGKTAIVGGRQDNGYAGAAWGFFLSGGVWTQQSVKLVGGGGSANSEQGWSVALSADGSTAILGGPGDATTGAAWVFTQPSLQVASNVDMTATGAEGGPFLPASFQYQLSATGGTANYSILGVPNWLTPSSTSGAASSGINLTFTVNANANSLAPNTYTAVITFANAGSNQGTQTRNATLVVNPPAPLLAPSTGIAASGMHGGPFSPSSFRYTLSSTFGRLNYSITTPSWLNASSKSGTVTTSPKTITFTVSSNAHSLQPNTYVGSVSITNTTNGQGNTSRVGTLTINPKDYKLTVSASPTGDGSVAGGGEVAEATSATVTATANSGFHFVQWTENGRQVSTSSSYTFTMPSKTITLTADFQKN